MSTAIVSGFMCMISYWIGYRLGLRDGGRREDG